MPLTYDHIIHVQPADLDELNHVNNVVYVRWIQEAAAAHWNREATPDIKKRFFWVVLRHEIDYKAPAFAGEELIARTWVHAYDGARSIRMVQMIRKHDQRLLAESKTTWCLLSAESHRPVRVPEEISLIFTTD